LYPSYLWPPLLLWTQRFKRYQVCNFILHLLLKNAQLVLQVEQVSRYYYMAKLILRTVFYKHSMLPFFVGQNQRSQHSLTTMAKRALSSGRLPPPVQKRVLRTLQNQVRMAVPRPLGVDLGGSFSCALRADHRSGASQLTNSGLFNCLQVLRGARSLLYNWGVP
jgi:hypothetical protein